MVEEELQKVLAGCLKQDRKDQKLLYKSFYGFAMGICLRYAGNRYEASEIMNQGFLKVFTKLEQFDTNKPFKAWLGRIMINTSINYYRSNLKMAYADDIDDVDLMSNDELPDHKLAYDDLLAMVQQLPQAYRTVFNLYAIEGYAHEEIGKMLGISDGTSKSNLFKAREKLRKMILAASALPGTYGSGYSAHDNANPFKLNTSINNS
jgi:RNA polymerase sigma-70 factor (ECF subfamily)